MSDNQGAGVNSFHGGALPLRQLQEQTLPLILPGLYVAGLLLLVISGFQSDPFASGMAALVLFSLPIAVWSLHPRHYLAATWLLIGGCILVTLLVVWWGEISTALFLLVLPVGLASLLIRVRAGIVVAGLCTVLLLVNPFAGEDVSRALRVTSTLGIWGTVGLIWLAQHALLTAITWSWSSYTQSQRQLEQARDYQVQLSQALDDLAAANVQLTRLIRLTKGLQHAAEDARRVKAQFVANVSHELRTPLNMVLGFSEMMTQTPALYGRSVPPALLSDLAVILQNSRHLSRLIDDVLDLSQLEMGKMALTRERVDLYELVAAAITAVRPLFNSKSLALRALLDDDLPPVFCDRTRIRQVLLNLLSNAGRFTEHGGVTVTARRDGSDVLISVRDTGPGIGPADVAQVFEPFQQLDDSLRRQHGGNGLGLTISKQFVEMHGGTMWAESEQGSGTTFHFRIPIYEPIAHERDIMRWFNPYVDYQERVRPAPVPLPSIRPRLVVLEQGNVLSHLLLRYMDGNEVVAVATLDEAIAELARTPAQALLINSPLQDTQPPVRRLAEVPYDVPTIVCSIPETITTTRAGEVARYLVKPITPDDLVSAMERLPIEATTILLVDDEPDALRLYRRMLRASARDYRVLRATSGRQALEIIRTQPIDVVVLDLIMPDMDGFAFLAAKNADAQLQTIPVVVISGCDPSGQPIVSGALTVTRRTGLPLGQLLATIESISRIFGTPGQTADPALSTAPGGSPVSA